MHRTQCQLLGSISLDFVHSGPSNMHRCRAFLFALAKLSSQNYGREGVNLEVQKKREWEKNFKCWPKTKPIRCLSRFLRATACNALRVLAIVEVSVRLSVTPLTSIKTVQDRITKFLLCVATGTLVYCDNISGWGGFSWRGRQRRAPPKTLFCRYLLV